MTVVIAALAGTADILTIPPGLERAMRRSPELFSFLGDCGIAEEERAGFVYGSYTGLALTIFGLVPTFTAMLGKSVLPRLTAAVAKADREGVSRCVGSVLLISSAISLPAGLGIAVLSKNILCLFFAGRTAEIALTERPLAVLGAAVVFMGIALPCLTALQACGKQTEAVFITLAGTAVKLLLNILLVPLPGIDISGAAISTAVSQGVICTAAVIALLRGTGVGKECAGKLLLPVLPAALSTCAAFLTQNIIDRHCEGVFSRFGVLLSVTVGLNFALISFGLLCISLKNEVFFLFSKKITKNP